jgi:tetratricopeptide (TPR) repeat protein
MVCHRRCAGATARSRRGSTFARLRRFDDAKDAAKQAVKQSPDYGPAWALLGKLYSGESRYADAADAFQKAARLMPKDAEFWRSLAESYSKMNEPAKSQEALQKSQTITDNARTAGASPMGPKNHADDQHLERFTLARHDGSVLVPKSIFPNPPETAGGKRTTFRSSDGKTKMEVFVEPQNSMPISRVYQSYVSAGNLQPHYEAVRTNWFVISGDKNGRGYYVKCVARNNLLYYMAIEYDEETCPIWQTTFTAMSRDFLGR